MPVLEKCCVNSGRAILTMPDVLSTSITLAVICLSSIVSVKSVRPIEYSCLAIYVYIWSPCPLCIIINYYMMRPKKKQAPVEGG